MLGVDFSLIPVKGWQLYGQLAVDDFLVPETESGAEDYKPTALAWGVGTRFVKKNIIIFIFLQNLNTTKYIHGCIINGYLI